MPSTATITSTDLTTFVQKTTIKSSEVNNNFGIWRGHNLPVDASASSAADNAYDLGSDGYRWRAAYLGSVDFRTSTSTASLVMQGQTGNTTGAFEFLIEGVTVGAINASGFKGDGSQLTGVTASQPTTVSTSGSFEVTSTRYMIAVDASAATVTASFPAPSAFSGGNVKIVCASSGAGYVYLVGLTNTTLFNGQTSTTICTKGESIVLSGDGSNNWWFERYIPSVLETFGAIAVTATTTAPTKGTTSIDRVTGRRVGDSLEVIFEYRQTSAGTVGSGDYLWLAVPTSYQGQTGLTIDVNKMPVYSTVEGSGGWLAPHVAGIVLNGNGSFGSVGGIVAYSTTHVRFFTTYNGGDGVVGSGWGGFGSTNLTYSATFKIPITNWEG